MRIKLLILLFLQFYFLSAESYNWDILNKNGIVIHKINNARNVLPFTDDKMLIIYDDSFSICDRAFNTVISKKVKLKQSARLQNDRIPFFDKKTSKYGFIDSSGDVVINPIYDYVDNFVNGFAIVGYGDITEPPPHIFDLKVIDIFGNISSGFVSTDIKLSSFNPDHGIAYIDGTYKIIKKSEDKWVCQSFNNRKYNNLIPANDVIIYKKNNKYGFMTWEGEELTDELFSSIYKPYGKSSFIVDKGQEKNIIVDSYGTTLDLVKDSYRLIDATGYIINRYNNKYGVWDMNTSKQILLFNYDSIDSFSENCFKVRLNKLYGFISTTGKPITDIKYNILYSYSNGIAIGGLKLNK